MPVLLSAKFKVWLSVVFFTLAAMLVLISWLPKLAEQFLLPSLLRKSGLIEYQVSVYRLGMNGCTLRVSGKQGSGAIISAGNVQLDWSLSGLLERRLDRVVLQGLQVNYSLKDQSNSSTLKTFSSKIKDKAERTEDQPSSPGFPLIVDQIQVIDSFITFQDATGVQRLPFSVSARSIHNGEIREQGLTLRYQVHAKAAGQEVTADISYESLNRSLTVVLTGSINLQRFAREFVVNLPFPADIKGNADVTMQADIRVAPFSFENLQLEAHFKDLLLKYREFSVNSAGDQLPVISVKKSAQGYLLKFIGLHIDEPLKAATQFDALIELQEEGFQWHGNVAVTPATDQRIGLEYVLAQAPPIILKYEGTFRDNKAQIKIFTPEREGKTQGKFVVEHNTLRINAEHPDIEAQVLFDTQKNPSLTSTLQLSSDDLGFTAPGLRFTVPRVQLNGEGTYLSHSNDQKYTFSGRLDFTDGLLAMDEQEKVLQGIALDFPLTWPMSVNHNVGVLQIQNILLRKIEAGHFRGTWDQSPHTITLKGELQSRFIPESRVALRGIFRAPGPEKPLADFQFGAPDTLISLARFTPLFPALGSLSGEGLLNMEGQIAVYPGRVAGGLQIEFNAGELEIPEAGLKAEGVRFNIDFPDLPFWHTSPEQKLSIDRITNEKLVITDIKSSFRIESLQSLFVEKISGRWSKGRLFSSSFRLQKENRDFEAALFFDRLELAEILSQLGLAQAEGSGRLSGRVPISFSDGKLYVDDGFLYTAPGEKGILRVQKSEHLTAGIPTDVPQFSPLHFASAALRDFEYNWAKLHVLSEDENLMLKLQIDGKPGERLPFRFDQQNNVFVRLEDGSSDGIDQPVKLDINFNVPVNELFRYQQQLMPTLRKIR